MGAYKLNLGNANQYLKWTGSELIVKGSITLINTIPNAKVDGLGNLALLDSLAYGDITGTKPPSNADVTLSAIQGELSLAGGGLVLASAGAKIRGGQTAYGVGSGFWLGDVSGVSKFSIGNSANWLKWTGSALQIKGRLSVGAEINEDIYFEDSAVRMYDHYSGSYKGIALKYSTDIFHYIDFNPTTKYGLLAIGAPSEYTKLIIDAPNNKGALIVHSTNSSGFYIHPTGTENLVWWGKGSLQLPSLANSPTAHEGAIAYNITDHRLCIFSGGQWKHFDMTSGW